MYPTKRFGEVLHMIMYLECKFNEEGDILLKKVREIYNNISINRYILNLDYQN